jgi:adenine-specific DNA-methyltransferase
MSNHAAPVLDGGKWTDLLLPNRQRRLFRSVAHERFQPLGDDGAPELGIVTGNNDFFTLSEETRVEYGLDPVKGQVIKVCPPGTRHLEGTSFSAAAWVKQRDEGARVLAVQSEAR